MNDRASPAAKAVKPKPRKMSVKTRFAPPGVEGLHGMAPNASGPIPGTAQNGKNPILTPEMAGFRLLKLTNLMSRPFFAKFAKSHALSLNEWRSIVVLATRPGSAAQDVSAATGLHPMNISRALITLRKAGMIEEARDPENHRRTLLWLTRSGEKTFKEIAPHSESQARQLLDVLTSEELLTLGRIVDKLIARAEEITDEG